MYGVNGYMARQGRTVCKLYRISTGDGKATMEKGEVPNGIYPFPCQHVFLSWPRFCSCAELTCSKLHAQLRTKFIAISL